MDYCIHRYQPVWNQNGMLEFFHCSNRILFDPLVIIFPRLRFLRAIGASSCYGGQCNVSLWVKVVMFLFGFMSHQLSLFDISVMFLCKCICMSLNFSVLMLKFVREFCHQLETHQRYAKQFQKKYPQRWWLPNAKKKGAVFCFSLLCWTICTIPNYVTMWLVNIL